MRPYKRTNNSLALIENLSNLKIRQGFFVRKFELKGYENINKGNKSCDNLKFLHKYYDNIMPQAEEKSYLLKWTM